MVNVNKHFSLDIASVLAAHERPYLGSYNINNIIKIKMSAHQLANLSGNTTDASVHPSQVVYSNTAEQVISIIMFIAFGLITGVGQGSVIVTIVKTESLHDPHFFIILGACIADLLQVILSGAMNMYQFILNDYAQTAGILVTVLTSGLFMGMIGHVGLIAYERYVYFCRPLKYLLWFTTRKMVITMAGIYLTPTLYVSVLAASLGMEYHASMLHCHLPGHS